MTIIDEIHEIQAKTVADHEEKLRRDKDVCATIVHEMHEKIKQRMTDYYFAKNTKDETFEFFEKTAFVPEYYTIKINDVERDVSIPEYQAIVDILLNEGFKISQKNVMRERHQKFGFDHIRELKLEW